MKGRTYRYFTGEPLYPFGYGLSYTSFEYSNLSFSKPSLAASDDLVASVDVKNAGKMASDEVVQVYLTHAGVNGAPLRSLAGFQRVHVDVGATEHVQIKVPNRNLRSLIQMATARLLPARCRSGLAAHNRSYDKRI